MEFQKPKRVKNQVLTVDINPYQQEAVSSNKSISWT